MNWYIVKGSWKQWGEVSGKHLGRQRGKAQCPGGQAAGSLQRHQVSGCSADQALRATWQMMVQTGNFPLCLS